MLWKSALYRRKFGGNQRVLPYSFNLVIGGGWGGNSTRFSPCHPWQRRPPPPPVHRGWTWWWPLDAPAARMAEGLFYKRVRRRKKKNPRLLLPRAWAQRVHISDWDAFGSELLKKVRCEMNHRVEIEHSVRVCLAWQRTFFFFPDMVNSEQVKVFFCFFQKSF